MSHAYHDNLPGYDAGNVLHDSCDECEERAGRPLIGLTALDPHNFRQAWADMLAARWGGGDGLTRHVSACDERLHDTLYTVAVLLERFAGQNPRDTLAAIDARNAELDAKHAAMFGPRP